MNNKSIIPFLGTDDVNLNQTYSEVKDYLKNENISFNVEIWENKGCTPEVPWKIIRVKELLSIFFVNDKMFKICFEEKYTGKLSNGIGIGTSIEEAKRIDSTIEYDEFEEYYSSEKGYWLEDELDSNTVTSITVFIKEALDDEEFYSYDWSK